MKTTAILLGLSASWVSAQFANADADSAASAAANVLIGPGGIEVSASAGANANANANAGVVPPPYYPPSEPTNGSWVPPVITGCTTTKNGYGTSTITDVITSTYCPVCDEAKATGDVYVTTYETVYASVCPTGITSVTYIVSQTCTGTTPIDYATCPPGFVTTATVCTVCPGSPTLTVTQPCNSCPQATTSNKIIVGPATTVTGTAGAIVTPAKGSSTSPITYNGAASSISSGVIAVSAGIGAVFMGMLLL